MSFFDVLDQLIEGRKIKQPIFTKDFMAENRQLNDLNELSTRLNPGPRKDWVVRDINYLKQGLEGERNVYYELKNSFLPILCLHDIRLEYEGYVAQFDFVVISSKFICILETKKLNGDIEITRDGDFIRIIRGYNGRFIKKEGMYSPISQNERHVKILREILAKNKLIVNLPVNSLVVMANPKTILDKSKCPAAIQQGIYKYDHIANYLKDLQEAKNDLNMLEKYMYQISEYLIKNDKPLQIDYIAKYGIQDEDFISDQGYGVGSQEVAVTIEVTHTEDKQIPNIVRETSKSSVYHSSANAELYAALKKYRLQISRVQGLKPYMVYTDKELDGLIEASPKNKDDLLKVKGFAEKKVAKYGDAIIKIFNEGK